MIDITTVVLTEDELKKNGTLHENWDYVVGYKGLGFHKLGAIFRVPLIRIMVYWGRCWGLQIIESPFGAEAVNVSGFGV